MLRRLASLLTFFVLAFSLSSAWADEYDDTIAVFKKARESGAYFGKSYGYAVFPTIGKGGVVVGGAYGQGRVYEKGKYVGDTSMTQLSVGFQLGGEAYSQIIFFENQQRIQRIHERQLRIRCAGAGRRDHRGRFGCDDDHRQHGRREHHSKRCQERRQDLQRNDDLHGGQGRADV